MNLFNMHLLLRGVSDGECCHKNKETLVKRTQEILKIYLVTFICYVFICTCVKSNYTSVILKYKTILYKFRVRMDIRSAIVGSHRECILFIG